MNDAFIAGMVLEGAMGGGMALQGMKGRMDTADAINVYKKALSGRVTETNPVSLTLKGADGDYLVNKEGKVIKDEKAH